jgi:hypothetical protein
VTRISPVPECSDFGQRICPEEQAYALKALGIGARHDYRRPKLDEMKDSIKCNWCA